MAPPTAAASSSAADEGDAGHAAAGPPRSPLPVPALPPPQQRPQQAAAPTQAQSQGPTVLDRVLAALMFALPLSEGIYRLTVLAVEHFRRFALDLVIWSQVQQASIVATLAHSPASQAAYMQQDLLSSQTLMAWSHLLLQRLQAVSAQLGRVAEPGLLPVPAGVIQSSPLDPAVTSWLYASLSSAETLWSVVCLMMMVATMAWAQARVVAPPARAGRGGGGGGGGGRGGGPASPLLAALVPDSLTRRPEVVVGSCVCALLLRLCWAPMSHLCGVERVGQLYGPAAVALTLATTFISSAAIAKVLVDPMLNVGDALSELFTCVKACAFFQRALVAFDCCSALLFGCAAAASTAVAPAAGAASAAAAAAVVAGGSALPLDTKLHIALVFLLYNVALNWLQSQCDDVSKQLGLREG